MERIVGLARSGQLELSKEIGDVICYLSIGVATVINILNPSTVFLHGRPFDLQEDLFPRLLEEVRRKPLGPHFEKCLLVRARGNKRQGAVAAILDHLIESRPPHFGVARRLRAMPIGRAPCVRPAEGTRRGSGGSGIARGMPARTYPVVTSRVHQRHSRGLEK
jgi:predicted NBD/HSP70 family sugar kinase